jgi:hypothetical protein
MKRISLIYLVWVTLLILGLLYSSIHASETVKVAAIFAKTGDAATPNLMYFYSARFAVGRSIRMEASSVSLLNSSRSTIRARRWAPKQLRNWQ